MQMHTRKSTVLSGGLIAATAAMLGVAATGPVQTLEARGSVTVSVVASGLNDPRGLAFAPGGDLYIAEAGSGGADVSTAGECDQVQPPAGPALGGYTGRIMKLATNGALTVVASGLPSSEGSGPKYFSALCEMSQAASNSV